MATKTIRIGGISQAFAYDDGTFDSAIETDQPIKAGAPIDSNDVVRLGDLVSDVIDVIYPIGSIYLSTLATNPNTILGSGTWIRVAEGQFLVGFKTGDADFDPVENTGGAKTHDHPSTTSDAASANTLCDNNADGTTISVATGMHTHDTDLPSISHLPPFYTIYVWKRTA
jgi:hypothetical protein